MSSIFVSLAAFVAIFCSALAGVWLAKRLPEPHLSPETRTSVSVSMAVVGTLAALVLSLMVTDASTSFNARTDAVESLAVNIIRLNRALLRYGPRAETARETLQAYAKAKTEELLEQGPESSLGLDTLKSLETVQDQILALAPLDDRERQIEAQAQALVTAISDARWLLVEKTRVAVPSAFLVLLIFWLALLFASFGLFAPRNATVVIILFLCALAISGGILMILELGSPTGGLIRVSIDPLYTAIREITAGN